MRERFSTILNFYQSWLEIQAKSKLMLLSLNLKEVALFLVNPQTMISKKKIAKTQYQIPK